MRERPSAGDAIIALIGLAVGLFLLAAIFGGGSTPTAGVVTTTTTNETLSRNEVMSRNQLNLWSDVQNCYGDGSCPTTIITNTTTTVAGDRSTVGVQGGVGGVPLCLDPTTGAMTSSACNGTYAGGQP